MRYMYLSIIFIMISVFLSSLPPAPEPAAPAPSDQGLLIDVFGGPPAPAPTPAAAAASEVTTPPTATGLSPGAEEGFMRFLLKNNGVLFENEMLQIGVKSDSEYKKKSRLISSLFLSLSLSHSLSLSFSFSHIHAYINLYVFLPTHTHSQVVLECFWQQILYQSKKNFSSSVSVASLLEECLNIQTKPIDSTIENGAQVQQIVNVECKSPFFEAPLLHVQFR
jgi:AP-2 complex subunit alpha